VDINKTGSPSISVGGSTISVFLDASSTFQQYDIRMPFFVQGSVRLETDIDAGGGPNTTPSGGDVWGGPWIGEDTQVFSIRSVYQHNGGQNPPELLAVWEYNGNGSYVTSQGSDGPVSNSSTHTVSAQISTFSKFESQSFDSGFFGGELLAADGTRTASSTWSRSDGNLPVKAGSEVRSTSNFDATQTMNFHSLRIKME
jgi:hypothetical protein